MFLTLAFFNLGPTEIIIILALALLFFGKRLPEVGRNLGKGLVEFKKGLAGIEDEIKTAGDEDKSKKQIDKTSEQQKVNIGERHSAPADAEESPRHG